MGLGIGAGFSLLFEEGGGDPAGGSLGVRCFAVVMGDLNFGVMGVKDRVFGSSGNSSGVEPVSTDAAGSIPEKLCFWGVGVFMNAAEAGPIGAEGTGGCAGVFFGVWGVEPVLAFFAASSMARIFWAVFMRIVSETSLASIIAGLRSSCISSG